MSNQLTLICPKWPPVVALEDVVTWGQYPHPWGGKGIVVGGTQPGWRGHQEWIEVRDEKGDEVGVHIEAIETINGKDVPYPECLAKNFQCHCGEHEYE